MKKIRFIIFDLDGTLIDSSKDLTSALNKTLNDFNIASVNEQEVTKSIGSGIRNLLESILRENSITSIADAREFFQSHYSSLLTEKTFVYDGMIEFLQGTSDIQKVVLTNKSNVFVDQIMTSLNLRKYFSAVYGLESFPTNKPDPGPIHQIAKIHQVSLDQMIIIGDTEADIMAGRAAGIKTCAVSWGYGDYPHIKELEPTYWAHETADLIELISKGV